MQELDLKKRVKNFILIILGTITFTIIGALLTGISFNKKFFLILFAFVGVMVLTGSIAYKNRERMKKNEEKIINFQLKFYTISGIGLIVIGIVSLIIKEYYGIINIGIGTIILVKVNSWKKKLKEKNLKNTKETFKN
tara:strand:- start:219 stop:629 length:411 start_codon:yes stop_codon:yes gene_type:complete